MRDKQTIRKRIPVTVKTHFLKVALNQLCFELTIDMWVGLLQFDGPNQEQNNITIVTKISTTAHAKPQFTRLQTSNT